ncbi:TPA: hypothetical protein IAB95_06905 [Candidatus Ventrenecus avicola]|nr:hypothetical protein [Candidatus Ventrenecus avicola]
MKNNLIQKIDLLIEMAGTPNNYTNLSEELSTVNEEIEHQKDLVRDLKKTISENKYVNANERLIDENIRIGIENRLENLHESEKELKSQIAEVSLEEESVHEEVTSLERELEQLEKLLDAIELKMKANNGKSQESYSFYEKLLEKTNLEIEQIKKELEEKRKNYEQITKKMERLGENRENIERKIQKEEERLEEIKTDLQNPNAYVDQKRKQMDEKKVDQYTEALESLERHRLEIITNPVYIGYEAKDLILKEDKTSALEKIKELVTIVNSVPYMDIKADDLKEMLEEAQNKRDEFANSLEGKNYDERDYSLESLRIEYLEEQKERVQAQIDFFKTLLEDLEKKTIQGLNEKISIVRKAKEEIASDVKEYKKTIQKDREYSSPKRKTALQLAFKKKREELKKMEQLLKSFEVDLENIVIESKNIEEEQILTLEQKIKEIDEEIAVLKQSKPADNVKDILAIQKDKDTLKELNDEVEKIIHRQKYTETPSEIYDEIELAMIGNEPLKEEIEEVKPEDYVNLDDYRITEEKQVKEDEKEVEDTANDIPVPITIDTPEEITNIKEEESVPIFPSRSSKEPKELNEPNLLKVVNIEPLEDTTNSQEEEKTEKEVEELPKDDFMINDFNDSDYISFNDLLEGENND